MSEGRFKRLERQRAVEEAPTRPPSMESRFGDSPPVPPPEEPEEPPPSVAPAPRFEPEPTPAPRLRLLDLDEGQSFLRCGHCRADNYLTAARCTHCEADLTTPDQRAFNEEFWQQRLEEKAEQQEAIEEITAARQRADQEKREALRQRAEMERELDRRGIFRRPLGDDDIVVDTLQSAGHAAGGLLRRLIPNAAVRMVVVLAGGGLLAMLLWKLFTAGAGSRSAFLLVLVLLGIVSRWLRIRG